jgi:DNA-binding NarL/FixJ family response regulator
MERAHRLPRRVQARRSDGPYQVLSVPSDWLRALARGALLQQHKLTPGQLRVLELLAEGKSTEQIAAELYLSPRSVEDYIHELHSALGTKDRGALVARWLALIYQAIDVFFREVQLHLPTDHDCLFPMTAPGTEKEP